MCVDNDSRPPITPIAGGSAGSAICGSSSADGTKFMAYAARAAKPTRRRDGRDPRRPRAAPRTTRSWPTASPRSAWTRWPSTSSPARRPPTIAATSSSSCRTWGRRSRKRCRPTSPPRPHICAGKEGGQVRSLFSVGFCFGGALSYLQAASGLGYAGVIGFYGWPLGLKRWPDRPKPIDAVSRYKSPVLSLFGGADEGIPQADVDAFDGACKKAASSTTPPCTPAPRTASSTASTRSSPTPPPTRGSARRPSSAATPSAERPAWGAASQGSRPLAVPMAVCCPCWLADARAW